MPRRGTHALAGAVVGVGATILLANRLSEQDRLSEIIGGGIAGYLLSLLPDILEPASTPHHRGIAHSVLMAFGITRLNWQSKVDALRAEADHLVAQANSGCYGPIDCERLRQHAGWKHFWAGCIIGAMVGYASHLVLDAMTPSSLPLLGFR